MDLDVGRVEAVTGAKEGPGLGEVGGQRSAALGLEQAEVLLGLGMQQRVLGGGVGDPGGRVVTQASPDR